MNVEAIKDFVLRATFQAIAAVSEDELVALGLNSKIRDRLLTGITVPDSDEVCWIWQKGFLSTGPQSRPCIWFKKKPFLAYRVLMAIVVRKHIQELPPVLHKCPGQENCKCVKLSHLKVADSWESAPGENARDRSRYKTLHGPRNGAVLHPEKLLRGLDHPRCPFKSAREIQALRARWHAEPDKWGMIAALMRRTGISKASVTAAIHEYRSIPDDPTAAIDLAVLDIRRPADRFGDLHGKSIMPEAAVELFFKLFNSSSDRAGKLRLLAFVGNRYGMAKTSLADIGHGRSRKKIAKKLDPIIAGSDAVNITDELLETLFEPLRPLRKTGGK
ncbi:MAG: hypothetical protein WCS65_13205 [Verrucomicrobiae bacterium]